MLDLSVVIVNWNTRGLLSDCLQSVQATAGDIVSEVIVVDNGSSDGSQAMLAERFPDVRLLQNAENVGFARACNQGVNASSGQYALLLNSDAVLTDTAAQSMVALANQQLHAGVVGAQLRNPDGTFQASYTPFPTLLQELLILSGIGRIVYGRWYPSRGPEEDSGPQRVDYVEGACLLVRREAFEGVGGLDEQYFMYAEEVDLCYEMNRHGWEVWYHPDAKVIHVAGASSRNRPVAREEDLYRSRLRFFRKHYGTGAAQLLKLQMCGFTAAKIGVHGLLRLITRGRVGRKVVPLRAVISA
jgi:N-acetylglucosaminyl-diphospho-decaprenol L-rhamnosyltransferase